MKKFFLACLFAALCAGCGIELGAPDPTPTPSPSPTPVPPPVLAVLGGAEETAFLDMVRSIAGSAACDFVLLNAEELDAWRPRGRAALILYMDGAFTEDALEALEARDIGLYAYAARGQALPKGLCGLRYDGAAAAQKALDEALRYENHDTPVRLIGMFYAEDSGAAAVWTDAVAAGRVLDKGAYYEREAGRSAEEWLSGRLDELYAGMLDGLYCESAALARAAAAVMEKRLRDSVEIFCAGADGALLKRMQAEKTPLVRAAGAEPSEAGRLCAEQALVLLYGGTAETLTIKPSIFAVS